MICGKKKKEEGGGETEEGREGNVWKKGHGREIWKGGNTRKRNTKIEIQGRREKRSDSDRKYMHGREGKERIK